MPRLQWGIRHVGIYAFTDYKCALHGTRASHCKLQAVRHCTHTKAEVSVAQCANGNGAFLSYAPSVICPFDAPL